MPALLVIGGLMNPGNSNKTVNPVGSQLRFSGLDSALSHFSFRVQWSTGTLKIVHNAERQPEFTSVTEYESVVVDSKNRWSGFPNPLVPSLAHPGGLRNPPHTINDAGIGLEIAPRARSTPTFHQPRVRTGFPRLYERIATRSNVTRYRPSCNLPYNRNGAGCLMATCSHASDPSG
jgi:hypothetical protein